MCARGKEGRYLSTGGGDLDHVLGTVPTSPHKKKEGRKAELLRLIEETGEVRNDDVERAFGVSDATATRYLDELEAEGLLEQIGERGRYVSYRLKVKDKSTGGIETEEAQELAA